MTVVDPAVVDPGVDELVESLESLAVAKAVRHAPVQDEEGGSNTASASDDGYSSSSSTENLTVEVKAARPAGEPTVTQLLDQLNISSGEEGAAAGPEATTADKTDQEATGDDDDDKVLEPLVIVANTTEEPAVEFISRGPVSLEQLDHRFQPYSRPGAEGGAHHHHQGNLKHLDDDSVAQPSPNLLIFTQRDPENPIKLDAGIEWSDKHELCIEKFPLPEDTIFTDGTSSVQIFIQLNPSVKDVKTFLAHVKKGEDAEGKDKFFIGPIVISLKTDLADSQEKLLLKELQEEEKLAAINLVSQKEIAELVTGIGPHKDTVLSILCAKRKSPNPGQITAQIHAVVQRLIKHQDEKVRQTVFKLNNNGISAFEIAAITNNAIVACYLAEVMYNLIDDTRTALKVLNGKDSQGNTIVHLLARKGDCTAATLKSLLAMRLTDGTRVFSVGANAKKQSPLHIAAQGNQNQPETVRLLAQAIPRGFEIADDDGMTPLHYACQRTCDPAMVQTILSYKKDNINKARKDGMSALDLLLQRPNCSQGGMFPLSVEVQDEIAKLIRNNGGQRLVTEPDGYPLSPSAHGCGMNSVNSGYTADTSAHSPTNPNSPQNSSSPLGSPYSYNSPHTGSEGSPAPYNMYSHGMAQPGSVESYIQSSPESVHGEGGQAAGENYYWQNVYSTGWRNMGEGFSQDSQYVDQPRQEETSAAYEERLATQIINEFPEIRNLMGQILDGNL